ncbi:MAG: hypothetical protein ACXWG0_02370 [Chthoniobacterales bacterium]
MSDKPFVIITTELPPAMCGIGTYSWLLRMEMPNESSRVEFLVNKNVPGATTSALNDRVTSFNGDARQFARALDSIGAANVLLHYAGRAYARLGAPLWLARVLAQWKRRFPGSRIMVVVHELPASFPLTSRHFWLGKLSERVAARLARLADIVITNSAHHAERLRKISRRTDVHVLPSPSNIEVVPASAEPRTRTEFALVGLPFGRLQTLRLFGAHISQWRAAGALTKLHLIGPAEGEFARQGDELLDSSFVVRHGELSSHKVATLLRRAGFALTNASEETWSKSSAFMACAANECPIVVAAPRSGAGPFSFTIGADEVATISDAELTRRTQALADWYRKNAAWPIIAKRMGALWPNESS